MVTPQSAWERRGGLIATGVGWSLRLPPPSGQRRASRKTLDGIPDVFIRRPGSTFRGRASPFGSRPCQRSAQNQCKLLGIAHKTDVTARELDQHFAQMFGKGGGRPVRKLASRSGARCNNNAHGGVP